MSATRFSVQQYERCGDTTLQSAIGSGADYAGIISFEDVQRTVANGRHFFVSAVRMLDGRYEVILRGEEGAAQKDRR